MVWLESPDSQHSKTFFRIENPLNIKEVMNQNVLAMSDTVDTSIGFLMHSMLWMSTLSIQTKRKKIH